MSNAKIKIACKLKRGKDHEPAKRVRRGHQSEQSSSYESQRTEFGAETRRPRQEAEGARATGKGVLSKYLRQGLSSAGSSLLCVGVLTIEE